LQAAVHPAAQAGDGDGLVEGTEPADGGGPMTQAAPYLGQDLLPSRPQELVLDIGLRESSL
jgi:hypothetical protein